MGKTVQAEDLFSTKFYDFINELEDLYYLDNEWLDYLSDMGIDTIDWTISEIIEGELDTQKILELELLEMFLSDNNYIDNTDMKQIYNTDTLYAYSSNKAKWNAVEKSLLKSYEEVLDVEKTATDNYSIEFNDFAKAPEDVFLQTGLVSQMIVPDKTNNEVNKSYITTPTKKSEELDLFDFDTIKSKKDKVYMLAKINHGGYVLGNSKVLNLSNYDTSNVTNMHGMFADCSSLKELDLSNVDTSKVEDMKDMFSRCKKLERLDLSSFNTSKVTDMSVMFWGCESLQELDLSNFDTRNVNDMRVMFSNCYSLKELDLSSFDTSRLEDMQGMFSYCKSLTKLDLSSFNTSNVKDMGEIFWGCESLQELDLSSFDTSNVKYMSSMFRHCHSLERLDLSSFDTSKVEEMSDMFRDCPKLKTVKLSDRASKLEEYINERYPRITVEKVPFREPCKKDVKANIDLDER